MLQRNCCDQALASLQVCLDAGSHWIDRKGQADVLTCALDSRYLCQRLLSRLGANFLHCCSYTGRGRVNGKREPEDKVAGGMIWTYIEAVHVDHLAQTRVQRRHGQGPDRECFKVYYYALRDSWGRQLQTDDLTPAGAAPTSLWKRWRRECEQDLDCLNGDNAEIDTDRGPA